MKKLSSPLAKAVISLVNKRVKDSKSALPCVVTKLNSDSTVNLEVLTKSLDEITGEYDLIELYDVDVDFPASYEDAYIRFPVKEGTTGSITIYDNDISALMDGGNETPVDVESPRSHNIDDCKFKPDFQTDQKKITIDANAEFRNGALKILIAPDGTLSITGKSSKEVMEIITRFMDNAIGDLESIINDTLVVNAVAGTGVHSVALIADWVLPAVGSKAVLVKSKTDMEELTI